MDTLIVQLREARVNGRNVSHIVVRTPPLWYRIALDPLTDRQPDGMAFLGVPVTYHEAEEEGDVSEFSLVFEE
ncbi:hypothetical protein [Pseudomonas sp. Marseille-Q5115]|uniref:hypothetical protein n=1 Tax=Pseudomonas sp. Marseille-Q5115 TaxID=2866593 RepID=UPI001CE3DD8C|nr:hypothetical protein [Pseudomonas sp. Marseille-Q5115]